MRRLIYVFVVRIWHKQVFSWCGSYMKLSENVMIILIEFVFIKISICLKFCTKQTKFWNINIEWLTTIRAVPGQHSLPELCLANKAKMHLKQTNELRIARGCSIFWYPAPPHGMYPAVSSYGMEADPPRFLYLKDEYFLMTDWCDIDISLIMKNSKSVTLTSRSMSMGGDGTA